MPTAFSFDFGHRFVTVRDWAVAFLVFTEHNVYTPDPAAMTIENSASGMTIRADVFAWAGLQQKQAGKFAATFRYIDGGFDCAIEASLHERIKGTAMLLRDRFPIAAPSRDFDKTPCPAEGTTIAYPSRLRFPIFPLWHGDGSLTAVASLDEQVRGKTLAVLPSPGGAEAVLEFHHHEDARRWAKDQVTPPWRVLRTRDATPLFDMRGEIAERCWGLAPWATRPDVPEWMRKVGLVLNLHGAHWTGYVFNTYAQQLDAIRYVAEKLGGHRVLAFLAAWDGRYNYNWPRYEADEAMGGADGLMRLVREAQALGVRVIPQIGAVSANRRYLPAELYEAASQDAYGNTYVKDVDWDNDRVGDTYRINANLGHPGFREFLLAKTFALKERFGFDGIFLDINMHTHNDPRFNILEGHRAFAKACHERFKNFLLFGENWYDGLMPVYPLVQSVVDASTGRMSQWSESFDRYCRTSYHLCHPAPGAGLSSTGVYEAGLAEPFEPDPTSSAIPALAIVLDTLARERGGVDRRIAIAKSYIAHHGL